MTDREIMQQALDALEYHTMQTRPISHTDKAIEALRQALAQPEPVQVRPHEFIAMASKQANMIGKPVVWAEYPTPHKIILDEGWEWGHDARAKEALAQPEQEPVAWCSLNGRGEIGYFEGRIMVMAGKIGNEHHETPLYTAPPKREWVELTDSDVALVSINSGSTTENFVNGIKSKLKELNT